MSDRGTEAFALWLPYKGGAIFEVLLTNSGVIDKIGDTQRTRRWLGIFHFVKLDIICLCLPFSCPSYPGQVHHQVTQAGAASEA